MNRWTSTICKTAAVLSLAIPVWGGLPLRAADDRLEHEERRQEIEEMSAADREQLRRRFEKYQKLSPEERERIRQLHAELEKDAAGGGHLRSVLENYHGWLKSLSPWQREELRKAEGTEAKLALIRKFVSHQDAEPERSRFGRGRSFYPFSDKFADVPPLSADELAAVTQSLEGELQLDEEQQSELRVLSGLYRTIKVLEFIAESSSDRDGGRANPWLPDLEPAIGAITNADVRKHIEQISDPQERKKFVGGQIYRSVVIALKQASENARPTQEQAQEFYEHLEPGLRDELMQLPPFEFESEIRQRYIAVRAPELTEAWRDLRYVGERLFPSDRHDRRGPGRGPGRHDEDRSRRE